MTHDTGGVLGFVATPFVTQVLFYTSSCSLSHMTHDTGGVLGLVATPFVTQVLFYTSSCSLLAHDT